MPGKCDVVMGVPAGMNEIATTHPYYRSGYVFVSRRDRHLNILSLDDPRLHHLRIGIHDLGDTDREIPPVHALTSRGIVSNLVGYNIFGANFDETNPSSDLIKAVENRNVDLALAVGAHSWILRQPIQGAAASLRLSRVTRKTRACRSASTLPLEFARETTGSNNRLMTNSSDAERRFSICSSPMAFHN